jgi:putative SOS response-associated peptidase YedK
MERSTRVKLPVVVSYDGGLNADDAIKPFAITDTTANTLLQTLHARMPVLLTPDNWAPWLGETAASDAQLKAMFNPYPSA